jgi:GT2 family glycosyltransferase
MNNGQIPFDCGNDIENFNEKKFLSEYKNFNYYDFNGSTWAPTLVHRDLWNKVGGFSEEYFPGTGSDPDFNMKLWNVGVRIFKGINDCKVYHFGSVVLRKKINMINKNNKYGSSGAKIFLLKWGFSIKFFKKFYLKSNEKYDKPLSQPKINFMFICEYILNKINFFYIKFFYKKNFKS